MTEAELIALGLTGLTSLIQTQLTLAQAKANAAATSADEKAKIEAALDAFHTQNATLNSQWQTGRP